MKSLELKYPAVELLESGRFAFIKNEVLRRNVSLSVQYVAFLTSLLAEFDVTGPVASSMRRNIILVSASVAEGLINYKLHEMVAIGKVDVTSKRVHPVYRNIKTLHQINPEESIIGATQILRPEPLGDSEDFIALNKMAKKSGLFTQHLFNSAEILRKKRNKIHLASLDVVDDKYDQSEIDECFNAMKDIIDCIAA